MAEIINGIIATIILTVAFAKISFKLIGKNVLGDDTFVKDSENIIGIINSVLKSKSKKISIKSVTYNVLKKAIEKLKDLRNHDYASIDNEVKNEKKSEE